MDGSPTQNGTSVAQLRVLASGSGGNCSVLRINQPSQRRSHCLIDAGLSPRRTAELLTRCCIALDQVAGVLLTHLDHDHWYSGWTSRWPKGWHLWLSRAHADHARRRRLVPADAVRIFEDEPFEPAPSMRVTPFQASHDELGVSSFRFDLSAPGSSGSLGFATDLGRVPEHLIHGFRGVHVLAIESNYCPQLQMASSRPMYLKRRIMGGDGHLSNEQTLQAITGISPRDHVVLLHLSRECNDPGLVASMHAGSDYALTITSQDEPSRWVDIEATAGSLPPARSVPQPTLFPIGAPGASA